jgi:tetratricopeptide (TPR) repeat protein
VANHLAAQRGYRDDLGSIERGLRRLRKRGHLDGGVWGQRLLATFGLPKTIVERVRWMAFYHSRFSDLPTSICRELLLAWNQPPVAESGARAYLQLGLASVALRLRQHDDAGAHLEQALRSTAPADARAEHALTKAYLRAREAPRQSAALLDSAEALIDDDAIDTGDRACFFARLIDQRAYSLNKPGPGERADHEAALELYLQIPEDGPLFARCRRHNGIGWSQLRLGRRSEALAHARASVQHAGDSGSLRLRAMALNLLRHALDDDDAAASAARRATAIATRLEDEELLGRYGGSDGAPLVPRD